MRALAGTLAAGNTRVRDANGPQLSENGSFVKCLF